LLTLIVTEGEKKEGTIGVSFKSQDDVPNYQLAIIIYEE